MVLNMLGLLLFACWTKAMQWKMFRKWAMTSKYSGEEANEWAEGMFSTASVWPPKKWCQINLSFEFWFQLYIELGASCGKEKSGNVGGNRWLGFLLCIEENWSENEGNRLCHFQNRRKVLGFPHLQKPYSKYDSLYAEWTESGQELCLLSCLFVCVLMYTVVLRHF